MNKNTSISLGNYFDQFVQSRIREGRFKNVSEVIRADFDPINHLESLKSKKHSNG